jgi:hypothetical protein
LAGETEVLGENLPRRHFVHHESHLPDPGANPSRPVGSQRLPASAMARPYSKIRVISFSRKTTALNYQYRLGNSFIFRTDCIKDLGVHINSKLHFHQRVDFLFSHSMKLLGLIRTTTFSFSTLDNLLMLYIAIVRSKLKYASVVWNSITNTDANKLERIQRKFSVFCHNRFLKI